MATRTNTPGPGVGRGGAELTKKKERSAAAPPPSTAIYGADLEQHPIACRSCGVPARDHVCAACLDTDGRYGTRTIGLGHVYPVCGAEVLK